MDNIQQTQLEIPLVMGQPLENLPDDLFIPPNAFELCLETFSGPMDLLLYLIKKEMFGLIQKSNGLIRLCMMVLSYIQIIK